MTGKHYKGSLGVSARGVVGPSRPLIRGGGSKKTPRLLCPTRGRSWSSGSSRFSQGLNGNPWTGRGGGGGGLELEILTGIEWESLDRAGGSVGARESPVGADPGAELNLVLHFPF